METSASVRATFESAKQALERGDRVLAREGFARLTELQPRQTRAWLWRGLSAENHMAAALHYRHALDLEPDNAHAEAGLMASLAAAANALVARGVELVRAGQRPVAREAFTTALRLHPGRTEALVWLALVAEDPREAAAHLQASMHVHAEAGVVSEGAREALERTRIRLVRWLVAEGARAANSGDEARAMGLFDDALGLAPAAVDVLVWRASLEKDAAVGRALVARALEVDPAHVDALRWQTHFEEGDDEVELDDADVTATVDGSAAVT